MIQILNRDMKKFADLFVRTLFQDADDFEMKYQGKDVRHQGGEEYESQEDFIVDTLLTVCMVKGVNDFLRGMQDKVEEGDADEAFVRLLNAYGDAGMNFLGSVTTALHETLERDDYPGTRAEHRLHEWLEAKGLVKEVTGRLGVLDAMVDKLRDLGERIGIPSEVFDHIDERLEGRCLDPDAGVKKKVVLDYGPSDEHPSHEYHGVSLGYWVVCPEHGRELLRDDEYTKQLLDPDRGFRCPVCDAPAVLEREMDGDEA
jgi:hypothetical protein